MSLNEAKYISRDKICSATSDDGIIVDLLKLKVARIPPTRLGNYFQ